MNLLGSKTNQVSLPFNLGRLRIGSGMVFGVIILTALLAFEMFNYSTTDYALRDLLGELRFAGLHWATILTVAFCGIDFAGIARLFTPEQGHEEPKEAWYLFGAWLLAATMNAMLTWWGVSMAIVNHSVASTSVVSANTLTRIVPVFVAVMVWVIRILIIGSLSVAGERLALGQRRAVGAGAGAGAVRTPGYSGGGVRTSPGSLSTAGAPARGGGLSMRPSSIRTGGVDALKGRGEPSYHSLGGEADLSAKGANSLPRKF